jgi:leucyl-tRNA synthetase
MLTQGMVLAESYYTDAGGRREWVNPAQVKVARDAKGKIVSAKTTDGREVVYDGIGTMSKSKNNGVDPQDLIDKYGADTARFFIIFASPPTSTLEWSDEGVDGSFRFLKRLWSYCAGFDQAGPEMAAALDKATRFEIHSVLKQANYDLQKLQFNTVASAAMKILNALERFSGARNKTTEEGLSILLRLLSPITPHVCHALWRELGFGEDVLRAPWPEPDPPRWSRMKSNMWCRSMAEERHAEGAQDARPERPGAAGACERADKKYIGEQAIRRIIIVPGRLINIVV